MLTEQTLACLLFVGIVDGWVWVWWLIRSALLLDIVVARQDGVEPVCIVSVILLVHAVAVGLVLHVVAGARLAVVVYLPEHREVVLLVAPFVIHSGVAHAVLFQHIFYSGALLYGPRLLAYPHA